ncbi:MAG: hypothetical protein IT348_19400 [Candidatus Eisenbacteria bacterium]|nr:hypothetical protein [Candidatus Eisenbacteria bacterium]
MKRTTDCGLEAMHAARQQRIAEDAAEILAEVGRYPQAWHEETADELRARFDRMRARRAARIAAA